MGQHRPEAAQGHGADGDAQLRKVAFQESLDESLPPPQAGGVGRGEERAGKPPRNQRALLRCGPDVVQTESSQLVIGDATRQGLRALPQEIRRGTAQDQEPRRCPRAIAKTRSTGNSPGRCWISSITTSPRSSLSVSIGSARREILRISSRRRSPALCVARRSSGQGGLADLPRPTIPTTGCRRRSSPILPVLGTFDHGRQYTLKTRWRKPDFQGEQFRVNGSRKITCSPKTTPDPAHGFSRSSTALLIATMPVASVGSASG